MKYTTEMVEEAEIEATIEALCDGSLELNKEFLIHYADGSVGQELMRMPARERKWALNAVLDPDDCYFAQRPSDLPSSDAIVLDITEIEIQFEGNPSDCFADLDDWVIKGDLAYHNPGHGLVVPVNLDELATYIDEYFEGG